STSLLDLSRVLEPLLVVGGLLPPLVGGAGADQVHVRAQVLTVLPGAVAGAVGPQTEVLGCEFFRGHPRPRDEVAALKSDLAFHRTGVLLAPEPVPVGKIQAAFPVEGLPARHEPEHGRARPIDILRLVEADETQQECLGLNCGEGLLLSLMEVQKPRVASGRVPARHVPGKRQAERPIGITRSWQIWFEEKSEDEAVSDEGVIADAEGYVPDFWIGRTEPNTSDRADTVVDAIASARFTVHRGFGTDVPGQYRVAHGERTCPRRESRALRHVSGIGLVD